jgi:glycosidase
MRKYMISVMEYWVRDFGIDGFRCDAAGAMPLDFWEIARRRLDAIKPVVLLSDDLVPEHAREVFDALPGWLLVDTMGDVLSGRMPVSALGEACRNENMMLPKGSLILRPTGPFGNDIRVSDLFSTSETRSLVAAHAFVLPGIPHVYNGMEAGNYPAPALGDRGTIVWKKEPGTRMFFEALGKLRTERRALAHGEFLTLVNSSPDAVTSFERRMETDRVIIIANWTSKAVSGTVHMERSPTGWIDAFSGVRLDAEHSMEFNLAPYAFKLLLSGTTPS